ncbi:MAG: hypothetical protein COW00_05570 [Bdellovibrio sp. CG12_big_fil_rev_8_21_14_0_65_39_13]|nr:MAG: hypothetical protein COW78_18105 [Bdellovibrio sp. CG22_combo_CG10-13_8_21_14_all_39_27]PIQ60700.1 MAG: hypothetical protein COW00_05570 [Bdellovibrio sp. CG12_big_fil_rev_8_21_14_0_65_39_13]PIR37084.1 MAG: hypothetical protein COV37_00930 [Bdellovibrio sp. CG11_big_fil_rev_8_21_14_0_20_39_38]PJB53451.1 MAG: hypothetical protein CO099_07035 [Bdellovibrio sp. CG_4_9_14_3_um_filter_39_7]
MIASALNKTLIGTATVALAAIIVDTGLHSQRFNGGFTSGQETIFISKVDESYQRNVASSFQRNLPRIQIVESSQKNKINGKWEILRIVDTKGVAVFDKFQNTNDKKNGFVINMDLISTSTIRINNEKLQEFRISRFDGKESLVLFKFHKDGYEILEARKVLSTEVVNQVAKAQNLSTQRISSPQAVKGLVNNDNQTEFVLESALDLSREKDIANGDRVSGRLAIVEGAIQEFSATLFRGTDKEVSLEFSYAEIEDGGVFVTEMGGEKVNGIVTNNGKNAYRIRFATGPAAGAMLNFTTEEALSAQAEIQEPIEQRDDYVDQAEGERENAPEIEVVEVNNVKASEVGFDFSQPETKRAPANK